MTKKSGLFDIDLDLEEIEITPQKSKAKVNHSKKVEDALSIILQQMRTSNYGTRKIKKELERQEISAGVQKQRKMLERH